MVLQNFGPSLHCLFLPGKTRGASEFKFGNVEAVLIPSESSQLGAISTVDYRHDVAESHGMSFITDLSNRHQGSGHGRNLKHGMQISFRAIIG